MSFVYNFILELTQNIFLYYNYREILKNSYFWKITEENIELTIINFLVFLIH